MFVYFSTYFTIKWVSHKVLHYGKTLFASKHFKLDRYPQLYLDQIYIYRAPKYSHVLAR